MFYKFIILFVFLFCMISCTKVDIKNFLPGDYTVKYPHGVEKLTIYKDGEFRQVYSHNNGDIMINNGKWSYDASESKICLRDAMMWNSFDSKFVKNAKKGVWYMKIFKERNMIKIQIDKNYGLYFEKLL